MIWPISYERLGLIFYLVVPVVEFSINFSESFEMGSGLRSITDFGIGNGIKC